MLGELRWENTDVSQFLKFKPAFCQCFDTEGICSVYKYFSSPPPPQFFPVPSEQCYISRILETQKYTQKRQIISPF